MKLIPLTNGGHVKVDDEDYDYLRQFSWYQFGGYARRTNDKTWMHILLNKTPRGMVTDHVNQNKLDNRRANLHSTDKSINSLNRGLNRNNTHGVRGVAYMSGRAKPWVVRIKIDGHVYYFGYYAKLEDASVVAESAYADLLASAMLEK